MAPLPERPSAWGGLTAILDTPEGQLDTELAATRIAHNSMAEQMEPAQPGPETTNKVFQHRTLVARSAIKTVELALVAAGGAAMSRARASIHYRTDRSSAWPAASRSACLSTVKQAFLPGAKRWGGTLF